MTQIARIAAFSVLWIGLFPALAEPEAGLGAAALKASWTQYGPGGILEARAVVEGETCPTLTQDLELAPMQPRAAKSKDFALVCTAQISARTRQAALVFAGDAQKGGKIVVPLALPASEPQRILVLGDTGCRIKGSTVQDCSDPAAWPFPQLSAAAARLRPDLVIHVGDFLYRESPCPVDFKGCQGTPYGDNWPTWDVDFFAPAAPLMTAAPWVILRGNHEDCARAGAGFLRLLGPTAYDPVVPCTDHLSPYAVPLKGLNLVVSDNANAPETSLNDKLVATYSAEFAALAKEPSPSWWLMHRPIWGLITGPLGIPAGGNLNLMASVGEEGVPAPVALMLAGHIHTFEAINYQGKHVPPQIVAGHGGDLLDPTPANLKGAVFQGSYGVSVKDGISIGGFGFLLMTKMGDSWTIDVYDAQGRPERQCRFAKGRVDCPVPVNLKRRRVP
ncbi:hypothetical protein FHS83_001903 [Rhizomicrobium palustre]|uniref:Calcineurin-like phosphoesterase domain-containing protein n=1 Tax=Rhizomicrobium palustre TaxID=189966 RepID=A0A846MZC3_9PROT|nr:metallophosphoesterase [Rhizomicrobium palustre]NIK88585.1 hypothetical protein [Rhizomicrobium palustre]